MPPLPLTERFARLLYPQTLALILATTGVVLALAVLVRIRATYDLDLRATRALQELDNPVLTRIAKWATFMGNSLTIILVEAGVFAICLYAEQGAAAVLSAFSLVALVLNAIVKNIVDRKRPGEDEVRVHPGPRWGFSYPSGHSMGAAAFYGFLAFLIWLLVPTMQLKLALALPLAFLPILVGLSRIYLGAHWLSDVVGGWAGGLLTIAVLVAVYPLPF